MQSVSEVDSRARSAGGKHVARLFHEPRQLVRTVAQLAAEGLARQQSVLLVVTAQHARRIRRRLGGEKVDHRARERQGQLLVVDADALLDSFLRSGLPDRQLFREAILGLLRPGGARRPEERAYDGMVDRLFRDGNVAAAARLEALWDEIVREEGIDLLCGYQLSGAATDELPAELARAHTEVVAELSSRERLLRAGGELFSCEGFEHTTTAAIVRRASTSESQLVKHFGGKEGLLRAIFERWWQRIDAEAERVAASDLPPLDRFLGVADVLLESMRDEPEIARLKLFEGRRLRGSDGTLQLSAGLRRFVALLGDLLADIDAQKRVAHGHSIEAIRSALLGAFEGMVRDRFMSRMTDFPAAYGFGEIRTTFRVLAISILAPQPLSSDLATRSRPM